MRLFLALVLSLPTAARAEFAATQPYPAIEYLHETRTDPPLKLHAVKIDLRNRGVDLEVAPGGPDPDGPAGKWQTTLDETGDIAERENFDVAVNGDFFSVETVVDPQTGKNRGYHEGQSALVVGPAMTDGRLWAQSGNPRPALVVTREGRAVIARGKQLPRSARQAIAGSHVVVSDGKRAELPGTPFSTSRHPRTAVGTADGGRTLVLVVVDGRRPGVSVGMSLSELADLMLELGCEEALNLDGGGSSTLVLRDPESGKLEVMNQPSDGKQRPVANVMGVRIDAPRGPAPPTTGPATAPAGAGTR